MKVFIYGLQGNMGRRYKTILEYQGHQVGGVDRGGTEGFSPGDADQIIVATPTGTHAELLKAALAYRKPVLCEKPLSTNRGDLYDSVAAYEREGVALQMVSQYDELVEPSSDGPTLYDYFKSGPDGLHWDCMNVVWHARGDVVLRNKSPFWTCLINGQQLDLRLMDYAYYAMLLQWTAEPKHDYQRILDGHEKAVRMGASWQR